MKGSLDEYLKDLLDDITVAVEQEDGTINVTIKDVQKVKRLISRNRRRKAQLERTMDIRSLFERKFVAYRNKLLFIYRNTSDESLKAEIKRFLEVEQGDVQFKASLISNKNLILQKCKGVKRMIHTITVEYRTQKNYCKCCGHKLEKPETSQTRYFHFSKDNFLEYLSQEDWRTESTDDDELNQITEEFVYETISFFATNSNEKILIDNNEFEKVKEFVLKEVVA